MKSAVHDRRSVAMAGVIVICGAISAWGAAPQDGGQFERTLDELLNINSVPHVDPLHRGDQHDDLLAEMGLTDEKTGDLFAATIKLMERSSDRLGLNYDAGLETQRVQESALMKLDQLIAEAERKSCSACAGGGGQCKGGKPHNGSANNASQGGRGSSGGSQPNQGTFSPGQVGQADPDKTPLQELRSEWGHLPTRVRDELRQGLGEPFSPLYESLTEAYFRRLAEDRK